MLCHKEEELLNKQLKLIKKFVKLKIMEDKLTLRGHSDARERVYKMMKRTILHGESQSGLITGARGSGKTTLVNSVLHQLSQEINLKEDAYIVKLNGLIHNDDQIALRAITAQLQLENTVGDKVFGTFAENLNFLLSCLHSGEDRRCKSMIFIVDEMDMFCYSGCTQTLLYNLFDITDNKRSPICVLGITSRQDFMELLEKRVTSRFSHRHIHVLNDADNATEYFNQVFKELLSLPAVYAKGKSSIIKNSNGKIVDTKKFSIPVEVLVKCGVSKICFDELIPIVVYEWNLLIAQWTKSEAVLESIEKFCYHTLNERIFRDLLVVCKLNLYTVSLLPEFFANMIDETVDPQQSVELLQSLSVLELSLVIAMKHGMDVFDKQPMNFEMVLHRYTRFANANASSQTVPRSVILKAFENLQTLEVIVPIKHSGSINARNERTSNRVQKEYKLFYLAVLEEDITEAILTHQQLPTEISYWYFNPDN